MTSFYNSIHHSISIHSIFLNSIKLHIIYKEEERKRKHVVETTPLTIKLSKWYDIYQFIKQKNILMLGNFLLYKLNWKRILNKSQSDHSDISHILTYFLCDGLGSTHKKWYWNPTGLSPSQRTVSFQFFFKCPTEFKTWSHQILNKIVWCIFIKLHNLTFVPYKTATMHSYATCFFHYKFKRFQLEMLCLKIIQEPRYNDVFYQNLLASKSRYERFARFISTINEQTYGRNISSFLYLPCSLRTMCKQILYGSIISNIVGINNLNKANTKDYAMFDYTKRISRSMNVIFKHDAINYILYFHHF